MRSTSSPRDYCTCMFSAFNACSFCSALDFRCAYIRLVKHVCFASSYIDFDYCLSPTHTCLKSSALLMSSELWKLLNPRFALLSTCAYPEDYFCGTFDSTTSLRLLGSAYTCIQLEIPGLRQKAGAAHELKPLSRHPSTPEPRDPTYVLGSLELDS